MSGGFLARGEPWFEPLAQTADGGTTITFDAEKGRWDTVDNVRWTTGEEGPWTGTATISPEQDLPYQLAMEVYPRRETDIQPDHLRVDVVDDTGNGFQIQVHFAFGHFRLAPIVDGSVNQDAADSQNPSRLLAMPPNTDPANVRILVGPDHVQLYAGFRGPAVHPQASIAHDAAEPKRLTLRTKTAGVGVSNATLTGYEGVLPNLEDRPEIQGDMPSFGEFLGTHYDFQPYLNVYRGAGLSMLEKVGDKPGRWLIENAGGSSHAGRLPDTEEPGYLVDPDAAYPANRDKGDEDYPNDRLADDERRKLGNFAETIRTAYEDHDDPSGLPVYFQLGNEVNWARPWLNHPLQAKLYVEYTVGPYVATIRDVSAEVYDDPDAIPIMLGSTARTSAADTLAYQRSMLEAEIEGFVGESDPVVGETVVDLIDYISIHYSIKGPYWRHYVGWLYDEYVDPGRVEGLWSTEEIGGGNSHRTGAITASVAYRYLDWWSRRDWEPQKGGCIYWGDWWAVESFPTSRVVQKAIDDYIADRPMRNLTDEASASGDPNTEVYVFAADDDTTGHLTAAVMDAGLDAGAVEGENDPGELSIPLDGEAADESYRVAIHRIRPTVVETQIRESVSSERGTLRLPLPTFSRNEDAVLVFATSESGDFGAAFQEHTFEKEPNKLIENGEIISFHYANMADPTNLDAIGNLDEGMAGDGHSLAAAVWSGGSVDYTLELRNEYETGTTVRLTFEMGAGGGNSFSKTDIYWDDTLLAQDVNTDNPILELTVSDRMDFSAGEHTFEMANYEGRPRLGALKIERVSDGGGSDGDDETVINATPTSAPGLGLTSALASAGGAGYILSRRLDGETDGS
jgi:hypothetical protein